MRLLMAPIANVFTHEDRQMKQTIYFRLLFLYSPFIIWLFAILSCKVTFNRSFFLPTESTRLQMATNSIVKRFRPVLMHLLSGSTFLLNENSSDNSENLMTILQMDSIQFPMKELSQLGFLNVYYISFLSSYWRCCRPKVGDMLSQTK